jgi:hypothetical protein
MQAQPKKARHRPPWWCRAVLAAALWPRPEFDEYSLKLYREYLRRMRGSKTGREAQKYALRETRHWSWAAGWRAVEFGIWVVTVVVRIMTFSRTAA